MKGKRHFILNEVNSCMLEANLNISSFERIHGWKSIGTALGVR